MASRWFATVDLSKKAVFLALLACLLPASIWAQNSTCVMGVPSVCIYNAGGSATYVGSGAGAGFHMDGSNGSLISTVYQINNLGGAGQNIGTLSLTTGLFTAAAGNTHGLAGNGTFGDGTLTITNTVPFNGFTGTLFTGSLTNITWIANGKVGTQYQYILTGVLNGVFEGNTTVGGETAQLYFHSKNPWNGSGTISLGSGTTGLIVPEPASMGLMGTGLLAVAMLVGKKFRNQDEIKQPNSDEVEL